ncbi:MAG TPA: tetratricopeptide repeat protein [Bacteroidia bacterium]
MKIKYILILLIVLSPLFWRGAGGEVFAQTAEEYCKSGAKKVDLKEYKEAIEDYTKAIELKPKHADGYNGRGLTLSKIENYKAAIQDFNKVIELSPKDIKAYHDRGTAKAKLGDNKGAVQDFTKVIELDPKHSDAYFDRGNAKAKLGDIKGSCLDWTKASELGNAEAEDEMNKYCGKGNKAPAVIKIDDILAKILYGTKKNKALANNKIYLMGSNGDTIKTTETDKYGDFEFRKVNIDNVTILVGMNDKLKNEKEIYLANQNGIIITAFSKTASGFSYHIIPADIKKLNPIEEEDAELKIDVFSKSTDKAITVAQNISYPTNEYKVNPDIAKKLDVIANILTKTKTYKLEIYAHTDSRGNDAGNLDLSNKRAKAVLDYLVSKGIDKNRLTAKGMGETKILNRCENDISCSEKEHAFNRRTEFKFIK